MMHVGGAVGAMSHSMPGSYGTGSGGGIHRMDMDRPRDELGMEWEEEESFMGSRAELDCTMLEEPGTGSCCHEWGMSTLELQAMGGNR